MEVNSISIIQVKLKEQIIEISIDWFCDIYYLKMAYNNILIFNIIK